MEQKGYAISSMLYPLLRVIMLPLAAVLMDTIGMPVAFLSAKDLFPYVLHSLKTQIQLTEETRVCEKTFSFQVWKEDLQEVLRYFKKRTWITGYLLLYGSHKWGRFRICSHSGRIFSYRPRNVRRTLFFIFHC